MKKLLLIPFLLFSSYQRCGRPVTQEETIAYAKQHLVHDKNRIKALYFLPNQDVDVKKILLGLINNELLSIQLAQFIVNDKDIANALCQAHERGVKVTGIVDNGSLEQGNQKVTQLKETGINLVVYKKPYSIMHLKCFLFGKNFFDKEILWLGSANTTISAYRRNQEYVHITENRLFVQQFKDKFQILYREISSVPEQKPKINTLFSGIWQIGNMKIMLTRDWMNLVKK